MVRVSCLPLVIAIAAAVGWRGSARARGATGGSCSSDRGAVTAAGWLERAERAMGIPTVGGRVVRYSSVESWVQDYQSDRTYPPFFAAFPARETWLDPSSGVLRSTSHTTYVGAAFSGPVQLNTESATYIMRDTTLVPAQAGHRSALTLRPLDAWAEVHDWATGADATVSGRCVYRDYPRIVLQRTGPLGQERLFLDPKTALPIKLDRVESHYLWGQVHVEYVYSTWVLDAGVAHPGSAFRMVDGQAEISRTISRFDLLPRDSAPVLDVPSGLAPMATPLPGFLLALPTDTLRIGPNAFVLKNLGYAEVVALERDTVFVLDATQSEDRARADSEWIAKLFPGRYPITVVVTDLAWPHIGGVRFWVASGATIVSHRASRAFLERVIAHRWTLAPDKLEHRRARARLIFRAVSDSLRLAGGDIAVYPIDGIGSEGALMVYLTHARVLWASDYVQDLSQPTLYASEVGRAAQRVGIAPRTVAAEHLPPSPWEKLQQAVTGVDIETP